MILVGIGQLDYGSNSHTLQGQLTALTGELGEAGRKGNIYRSSKSPMDFVFNSEFILTVTLQLSILDTLR